jgi:hypothetical protein
MNYPFWSLAPTVEQPGPMWSRGRSVSGAIRSAALVLCVAFAVALSAGGAHGADRSGLKSLSFGFGVGSGASDVLSVGDIRPVSRGQVFGDASIAMAFGKSWRSSVGTQIGGAWFSFREPLGASGNVKDQAWSAYAAVDRCVVGKPPCVVLIGVLAKYGEARAWSDTRLYGQEGPHTYVGGGAARVSVVTAICRRADLEWKVEQEIFHAHAHDPFTRSDFDWLGRALGLSVGVRVK